MEILAGKTLIMLVGPSAIGKSTLMNEATKQDKRFKRVRNFTTRPPRANDEPGHYIYLTAEELAAKRSGGEIISEVVSPTTGDTYGTLSASYDGEYCLLDTLANSVELYRSLPFRQTVTITLFADPEQWQKWFLTRYPEPSDDTLKRLKEAELSINWSLTDSHTYWLKNSDGNLGETARKLIDIVTRQPIRGETPPQARAMLEIIKRGMWT